MTTCLTKPFVLLSDGEGQGSSAGRCLAPLVLSLLIAFHWGARQQNLDMQRGLLMPLLHPGADSSILHVARTPCRRLKLTVICM